jgi:phosphodiesterase/alkaline phosphatase D-like protein
MLKTLALPEVALLPPSDYTTSGVTLSGTVGPREGGNTTYHFEYGTTESYGASTPESSPVGSDDGTYPAGAELTGLEPGTLYHYRLVATSPAGVREGKDQTFTTVPLLPTVDSTSASDVAPTTATLTATVNPGNGATLVIFAYGPGLSYGSRTLPTEATPADGADHPLSAQLTGLTPGTTYHYRAVAINFNGVTNGADGTFSTPDAPIVGGGSATGVTQSGALLSGNVQPGFSPTAYHFEYGPTSDYGHSTPAGGLGADNAVHQVTAALAGLAAGTTYHYRLVATNAIGTTGGADHTFATTPPAAAPAPSAPSPRCRKGFVRRHGRCVRKRHRHRHHAKHRKRHHRHGGRNA